MPGDQHRLNLLEGKFHWLSLIRPSLSLDSTVTVFDVSIMLVKKIVAMEPQGRRHIRRLHTNDKSKVYWHVVANYHMRADLEGSWRLSLEGYGVVFLIQGLCNHVILSKLTCL